MSVDIPNEFLCCITGQIMKEPVVDREGNTYERSAILEWLTQKKESPITRRALVQQDLAPNRALRDAIESWVRDHPEASPPEEQRVRATARSRTATQTDAGTQPQPQDLFPATDRVSEDDFGVRLLHDPTTGQCLLSVLPPTLPKHGARAAIDIVCVVDVSGSMGSDAAVQNERGVAESHGLCVLDVVKHAVRSVAGLLGAEDQLAVVCYSTQASTVLGLTKMTASGKVEVTSKLNDIVHSGRTNLWDGLHSGMELLKNRPQMSQHRNATVMLLTDGCPNIEPPRGHLPTLKNYYDAFSHNTPTGVPPFTVNTFGFGYELDSKLLNDIARESQGLYTFIPDAGLVGTVFINSVANLLSTTATSLTASIEVSGSDAEIELLTPLLQRTSFGAFGRLGTVQYGQSRDIYFKLKQPAVEAALFAKVQYLCGGKLVTISCESTSAPLLDGNLQHEARFRFTDFVTSAASGKMNRAEAHRAAGQLINPQQQSPLITALADDAEGQVKIALSRDEYFTKWGRHYLPSLVGANLLQQCNNFKDHSVQQYGGELFKKLQTQGESIFTKIPPPEPTVRRPVPGLGRGGGRGGVAGQAPRPQAVNMNNYYNMRGGCVSPSTPVLLMSNNDETPVTMTTKPASCIKPGDQLANGATVRFVVKIDASAAMPMVAVRGGSDLQPKNPHNDEEDDIAFLISPYHPVQLDAKSGSWHFPAELVSLASTEFTVSETTLPTRFSHIFSFVLNEPLLGVPVQPAPTGPAVTIAALGHEIQNDPVASHEYLGSSRIVADLVQLHKEQQQQQQETTEQIHVKGFTRDADTLRINGIDA